MTMRTVIAVAVVAFLCCASRPVAAAQLNTGVVVMTTTGNASSITLDITIADNGAAPGCAYYIINRGGTMVAFFARQLGVPNTISYTDTDVIPGHTYWYELSANAFPWQFPMPECNVYDFRVACGSSWGLELTVAGHVGADPVPVAHGTLVTTDDAYLLYAIESCGSNDLFYFHSLPPGSEQYLGQEVRLYGEYSEWSPQNGWVFNGTSLELLPCAPVAIENVSWGHVKSLYR